MTTPTAPGPSLDDIFDSAGGGSGAPSFAWPVDPANPRLPAIGGAIQGEITDVYVTVVKDAQTKEPKLNKNGQTSHQVNVTIQTSLRNWEGCKSVPVDEETKQPKPASEDTGLRRIYVKYKMLDAVAAAIQGSAQGKGGPRVGAKIAVKVKALIDVGQLNPLTDYEAKYLPPAADPAADVFAQQQAAPAPQQQAPATPAASAPAGDPWAGATSFGDEPPF